MYSVEALERGIVEARKNIEILEGTIEELRQQIKDYRIMIDQLERAQRLKDEAEQGVHIEVERVDGCQD
jgi:hypothetical protein